MVLNPANGSARAVTLFCTLTSIYLPLYLLLLFYTDNIYKIGKFNCIPLILGICAAEVTKYSLSFFFTDISFGSKDSKASKIKKNISKLKLKEIFKCTYLMIGSTAVFYILAVLFGAPVLNECEETLMFAVLLCSLTMFPACLHLGGDATVSIATGTRQATNSIAELLLQNMRMAFVGAWMGAVVIPLDWDRPWQAWPTPCCAGALVGYIASHVLVLLKTIPLPSFFTKINIK